MSPLARLFPILAALLLAGCTSAGHEHEEEMHTQGAMPLSIIVGVENQGAHDLDVSVRLLDANGTLAWEANFTAPASGHPEKHHDLAAPGVYTLEIAYAWEQDGETRRGADRATLDTGECGGLSHLTFVVDTAKGADPQGLHRECHE